jgi:hypothetical protein
MSENVRLNVLGRFWPMFWAAAQRPAGSAVGRARGGPKWLKMAHVFGWPLAAHGIAARQSARVLASFRSGPIDRCTILHQNAPFFSGFIIFLLQKRCNVSDPGCRQARIHCGVADSSRRPQAHRPMAQSGPKWPNFLGGHWPRLGLQGDRTRRFWCYGRDGCGANETKRDSVLSRFVFHNLATFKIIALCSLFVRVRRITNQ